MVGPFQLLIIRSYDAAVTLRLAACGCVVAHTLLVAQVDTRLDGARVSRILQQADTQSEAMDLARELTDVYGPRLTGSPHMKAAGDVVIRRLKQWGVDSARFERWGPFGPGWTSDRFVALAVAPAAFPLQAYPKAWTPGTAGEIVAEAVIAPVHDEKDFDLYRGKLRGKFVLTSRPGDGPTAGPLEFARRRMAFFVAEGVAALVEPGGTAGSVVVTDGRLRDDAAFGGNGFYPWPDADRGAGRAGDRALQPDRPHARGRDSRHARDEHREHLSHGGTRLVQHHRRDTGDRPSPGSGDARCAFRFLARRDGRRRQCRRLRSGARRDPNLEGAASWKRDAP